MDAADNDMPAAVREAKATANSTLVLGIDGSGKSTFLNRLCDETGAHMVEVSADDESVAFKYRTAGQELNAALVQERRDMYLRLSRRAEERARAAVETGKPVAHSGFELVTLISHAVMGNLVEPSERPDSELVAEIIEGWLAGDELKPDHVVLVDAPMEVSQARIKRRLDEGDVAEVPVGFNDPEFLTRYRAAFHDTVRLLGDAGINCMVLDSSELTPDEMWNRFVDNRRAANPAGAGNDQPSAFPPEMTGYSFFS